MFSTLDNKLVGSNIAKLRRHREIKATDIASKLGLSESAYTKYERGETAITLEFLSNVSEFFEVSPTEFLSATPTNIVENIHNSQNNFSNTSSHVFNFGNEAQEKMFESILEQNKKLTALLEKLAEKL
ncbi:MAG: helix-turn-helix transcriptional regulator [Filimonas sp.]|nr:helix-turn-helix transcriptional regulator [Filimonas sp.]